MAEDIELARAKAQTINQRNQKKRAVKRPEEALQMIVTDTRIRLFHLLDKGGRNRCLSFDKLHYRPTIVLTENNGKLAGSARSVKGFDIYDAIDACSEYVDQFGGHKYAAGLTLKKENLESFTAKFESVVAETIQEEMLIPQLSIDAVLNLTDIDHKLYRILKQMAPFGPETCRLYL